MKQLLYIFPFIFILGFSLLSPEPAFAENWGDGGGNVGEWLKQQQDIEDEPANDMEEQEINKVNTEGDDNEEDSFGAANEPNLFLLSLQMLAALAFVIFLIYALLKFVNKRSRSFSSHSTIESIGGVGLGANRSVQVVRIGKKLYLVGVGDSVQLLKEIEDKAEVEEIIEAHKPHQVIDNPINNIKDWVTKRMSGVSATPEEKRTFHHLLDREMKEVKKSQEKVHSAFKEKEQ